ncbi:MAG: lipopolysaccharide biosynthesis protein [Candidatus Acetothermia bacterium]
MELHRRILRWLKNPGQSLHRRVIHGGFWVFAIRVFRRLFGLVKTIILARLLAPEDFGLFGIAMLALATLKSLSRTGFGQAIIQKKEDTVSYLNSAWTVAIARNLILATLLLIIGPGIGKFFGEPDAAALVRVLAISVAIDGFVNIGIIYFRKEMEFHKHFFYEFTEVVVSFSVVVPLAFILRSAWALVYGQIATSVVRLLLSYRLHPFRPSFEFDRGKVRELYTFGRWVFGTSILTFLALQGDDIFAGKILGAAALGIYQLSFTISNSMATEISGVIGQVTFPAFSKLQDNVRALRMAFFSTVEAAMSLTIPLAFGIFILAPDFVHVVLEPKWEPMIPVMRLLTISGLVRSLMATGGPLVSAVGKPKINFWINLVRTLLIAAAIYPLTAYFGLVGTAGAVLFGLCGGIVIWVKFTAPVVEGRGRDYVRNIAPAFFGSLVMVFAIVLFKWVLPPLNVPLMFALIFLGIFVYVIYSFLVWWFLKVGPINSLQLVWNYSREEN